MRRFVRGVGEVAIAFWHDTRGIMLPYVTTILLALFGFSLLAIDGSRYMSLQTQMQAAADALALAGARELNQQSGAQSRAISAMDNTTFGNDNTLFGMGSAPTFSYTHAFYKSLPAASAGFTGTTTTSDSDTRFVAVTVTPVTVPTIFPVNLFQSSGSNNFSTGAQAIAGFTSETVCDIPPVFICNPYETAGMTDSAATQALRTAFNNPATLRQQLRMDASTTGPGHFGYLVPPDGCTGASCLEAWIATNQPRTCYQKSGVDLNTGAKTTTDKGFNARFDMYGGSITASATYPPSVNVRKGLLPQNTNNPNWCSVVTNPASPPGYYTTLPTYAKPILNTNGQTYTTGNSAQKQTIDTFVPSSDTTNIFKNQMITGNNIALPNSKVDTPGTTSILMHDNARAAGSAALTFKWLTSGLPLDSNLCVGGCSNNTTIFGNGNWDCANYWALNHTAAAPSGCTSSNPTISRYQVYRYEIANNLINDWSGNRQPNTSGNTGNGESGAPYCAGTGSGVDTTTGGRDRRIIFAAVINCLAQAALITGGQTANNVPVAEFGKFFMTQPVNADGTNGYLYGEMTGLVSSLDNVRILNQVQLYR
jgi:Flp pilus assembly protein TadG